MKWKTKTKLHGFLYSKNMANFEAFHRNISSSINPIFLKSAKLFLYSYFISTLKKRVKSLFYNDWNVGTTYYFYGLGGGTNVTKAWSSTVCNEHWFISWNYIININNIINKNLKNNFLCFILYLFDFSKWNES